MTTHWSYYARPRSTAVIDADVQLCAEVAEVGGCFVGHDRPAPEPVDDSPMAAAIRAKRGRNTGPAPRRLDRRR